MRDGQASRLARQGAALLGGVLRRESALAGGDLSAVLRIGLEDGREAVVKSGPAPRTEAAMLRAIVQAGAPAPAVLAVDDGTLVLEVVTATGGPAGAWPDLGVAAARLHTARGEAYGWPEAYAFGAVPIGNRACRTWPAFWAERRLLPLLPHMPQPLCRRTEALSAHLPDLLPMRPPAALLHGDFWAGNILTAGGTVTAFIDPACYYGDAEVDLAMLALFAAPPERFFDAYGTVKPGRAERVPVYQLWPALVHACLFGAPYFDLVARLLSATGH